MAGLISSLLLVITTIQCYNNKDFTGNMLLGYTFMLLGFSFVFVGIKNYREKYCDGQITFTKGLGVGFLIVGIAATLYVITWLFAYYLLIPDFMDRYAEYALETARTSGKTAKEVNEQRMEMQMYQEMYKNPLIVILFTYLEIVPVGILVSVAAAFALSRKKEIY